MASDTVLLVMPGTNTTVAPEMAALLPGFPRQLVARMPPSGPLTAETMGAYLDSTLAVVTPFRPERPALVVYACTSAGFAAGAAGNAAIMDRLSAAMGAPVVSMADGMVQALRHGGARRVAVLTPYLPEVNAALHRYLAAAGIEVGVLDSFECPTVAELCAVTEAQVLARAMALDASGCDALFIACSQLPTLGALGPLREHHGIPVWSSISATAWVAMRQVAAQAA